MEKETLTKIRKAGALREHKNNIYGNLREKFTEYTKICLHKMICL